MKKMLWRLCLPLLGLLPLAAQADIWGFVDSKGVAHFASERLDDRYELVTGCFSSTPERSRASAAEGTRVRIR